jgi:hypothetical protein
MSQVQWFIGIWRRVFHHQFFPVRRKYSKVLRRYGLIQQRDPVSIGKNNIQKAFYHIEI